MIRSSVDRHGQAAGPPARVSKTKVSDSVKIVEWSDEDRCFIGHCPGIIGPCCHGDDEAEVHRQLCQIVAEWMDIASRETERSSVVK